MYKMYRPQSNYQTYEDYESNSPHQGSSYQEHARQEQPSGQPNGQPQGPSHGGQPQQGQQTTEEKLLSLPNVFVVANNSHKQNLLNEHKNVILYIHATWCGPCKQVKPMLLDFFTQNQNYVLLMEDVDNKLTAGVRGVPFFKYYNNGNNISNKTGIHDFKQECDKCFS